ncbi:hypothetical protein ND748_02840 [Frankia sp. AiPs1]|uniref:hypothetical protein n=1 Tax=Frankia sp. AiPs1 TaxID=573493 RepID=UPI00204446F3|nr:hypothetical protein [Frankia sp. AiPs1]MCM3920617.1 hypothetical protein [Frankia sp. AiPs1]
MNSTPALDRLTLAVKEEFLKDLIEGSDHVRAHIADWPGAYADVAQYLRWDTTSSDRIRQLYLEENHGAATTELKEGTAATVEQTLRRLVLHTEECLFNITYGGPPVSDADLGAAYVELSRITEEEFIQEPDPLDYNKDDEGLPTGCDAANDYLGLIIVYAVRARLMKRDGRELVLAYAEAAASWMPQIM